MRTRFWLLAALLLLPTVAFAQDSGRTIPSGKFTPGHTFRALTSDGRVFGDAGGALGSTTPGAGYLSEIGITNTGTPFCINDALINAPGGYHQICLGANSLGGGLISYNAYGGASPLPLDCYVNGSLAPCFNTPPLFDPRSYGAVCGLATDSTSAIQSAVTAAGVLGGWVVIACPMKIATQVTIPNSVRLTGIGPVYYKGLFSNAANGLPPTWPATAGPALICASTTVPCIVVAAQGAEIDHLNLGNPAVAPPDSCPAGAVPCNNYNPTVYPFIISTSGTSNWSGLNIHDLSFNAASKCIDIEGTPNYDSDGIAGAQATIHDIWMNPCMNEGILFHNVDNTMRISNIDGDFWWYRGNPTVGYYVANNSVFFDIQYLANAQFDNIECFANKTCLQFINSSVTGNSFTKTFAAVKLQFSNFGFNLPCQGISIPNGNGTVFEAVFHGVVVGETQNFCGGTVPGTLPAAFFDLSSDFAQIYMYGIQSVGVQTLAAIGHGTSGLLSIFGVSVNNYSAFAASAPAFKISSGAHFNLYGEKALIVPSASPAGGPLIGPGVDGTQGYEQSVCVGGGSHSTEGAACLQGSRGTANTGGLTLFDTSNVEQGILGAATGAALNINSLHGSVLLNSQNGSHAATATFGADASSHNLVNLSPLPTTPPSGVGGLAMCVDSTGNVYVKASCP